MQYRLPRTGKKRSDIEWDSPTCPNAPSARLTDGRTRLANKRKHAIDLDIGAVVAAALHATDRADAATLPDTPASAERHLGVVEAAPSPQAPAELVADKRCHSRGTRTPRDDGPWTTRIAEPKRDGLLRRHGAADVRRGVVNTRVRLLCGAARAAFKRRAELVERGLALVLDRGGMRRRREHSHTRCVIHVAGANPGLSLRPLTGAGQPGSSRPGFPPASPSSSGRTAARCSR